VSDRAAVPDALAAKASPASRPTTEETDLRQSGMMKPKAEANFSELRIEFTGRMALVGQSAVPIGRTSADATPCFRDSRMT
jgi:hypothetical protein